MVTTTLLLAIVQLAFVPPEAPRSEAPPSGTICRRITLPQWNKPRTVCLTHAQWRELVANPRVTRQPARTGRE